MSAQAPSDFDARAVFRTAEGFVRSALALEWYSAKVDNLKDPAFFMSPPMLFGLAIELYYKCLIRLETGEAAIGHDLVKLFNKIPQASRRAIRQRFRVLAEAYARNPLNKEFSCYMGHDPLFDFDKTLQECRRAFILWRYPHEETPCPMIGHGELIGSARWQIMELMPELKEQYPPTLWRS